MLQRKWQRRPAKRANRCVDLFERPDGTFGFEEFCGDVEGAGAWTPVQYYSSAVYPETATTLNAAVKAVVRLTEALANQRVR